MNDASPAAAPPEPHGTPGNPQHPPGDRALLGLALMAAAMLIVPARDGLAKYLSADLPVLTIAWANYVAAAVLILPFAVLRHGRMVAAPPGLGSQVARTLLLLASMTAFYFAISRLPLANATAAYFIAPFIAASLAPFVLGERLTAGTAAAVVCGFLGVLFVLRPAGTFDPHIIWALAAGVLFALYLLVTRHASRQAPPLVTLAFQSALGAIILAPFAFSAGVAGLTAHVETFVLIGIIQVVSHGLSITALRFAPATLLSPLVYLEIVASVLIGLIAFDHLPTPATWFGIAIIIASGATVAIFEARRQTR